MLLWKHHRSTALEFLSLSHCGYSFVRWSRKNKWVFLFGYHVRCPNHIAHTTILKSWAMVTVLSRKWHVCPRYCLLFRLPDVRAIDKVAILLFRLCLILFLILPLDSFFLVFLGPADCIIVLCYPSKLRAINFLFDFFATTAIGFLNCVRYSEVYMMILSFSPPVLLFYRDGFRYMFAPIFWAF